MESRRRRTGRRKSVQNRLEQRCYCLQARCAQLYRGEANHAAILKIAGRESGAKGQAREDKSYIASNLGTVRRQTYRNRKAERRRKAATEVATARTNRPIAGTDTSGNKQRQQQIYDGVPARHGRAESVQRKPSHSRAARRKKSMQAKTRTVVRKCVCRRAS